MKNISKDNLIFPGSDIPPCFSNEGIYNLTKYLSENPHLYDLNDSYKISNGSIRFFITDKDLIYDAKKACEPLSFVIAKNDESNRLLSIPNPLVAIPLHLFILDNIDILLKEENPSNPNYHSSSRYYYDNTTISLDNYYDEDLFDDETYITQKYYLDYLKKQSLISDGKYYHLFLDIANCYNSIFPHTITYNLIDNQKKKVFANFAVLICSLNNNETSGILTGPYMTGLFAELLLSQIDRELASKMLKYDLNYLRYVDDMSFYGEEEEKLTKMFKNEVEMTLTKYKLQLNSLKSQIRVFPSHDYSLAKSKEISFYFKIICASTKIDEIIMIEEITRLIDYYLPYGIKEVKYVLGHLQKYLSDGTINLKKWRENDITIFLNYLFNLMLKQNVFTKNIIPLIITILKNGSVNKTKIITKWLSKLACHKHKEVVDIWFLYLLRDLNIPPLECVCEYVLKNFMDSDLGCVLALEYLYHNKLIMMYKDIIKEKFNNIEEEIRSRFGVNWRKCAWTTKYWLLLYCDFTNWHLYAEKEFYNTLVEKVCLHNCLTNKEINPRLKILGLMVKSHVKVMNFL